MEYENVVRELKYYLSKTLPDSDIYTKLKAVIGMKNKYPYCWQVMKRLRFTEFYSMNDVLRERFVKTRLFSPNIGLAHKLYKTLMAR